MLQNDQADKKVSGYTHVRTGVSIVLLKKVKEPKRPSRTSAPLSCFHLRAVWRKVALCNYQLLESLQKNLEQWQHSHPPCSRGTFLPSLFYFSHFQSQLIWGHLQSNTKPDIKPQTDREREIRSSIKTNSRDVCVFTSASVCLMCVCVSGCVNEMTCVFACLKLPFDLCTLWKRWRTSWEKVNNKRSDTFVNTQIILKLSTTTQVNLKSLFLLCIFMFKAHFRFFCFLEYVLCLRNYVEYGILVLKNGILIFRAWQRD